MTTTLEKTLNTFIAKTEKTKLAIVIPMFGYWKESFQLDADTIKATLSRIYSNVHQLYLIFIIEDKRIPLSVGSVLLGKQKGGNCVGVSMKKGSTYGEYLRAGIQRALDDTQSQYVIIVNPWLYITPNGIDMLVDRINRNDAYIVSGYECKEKVDPTDFDSHLYNRPEEVRGIDINLFGMKRTTAEMIRFDEQFKTHYFIGRDAWQSVFMRGFESIISQQVPIFSFDLDWTEFESEGQFEEDKRLFLEKWKYNDDSIKYP